MSSQRERHTDRPQALLADTGTILTPCLAMKDAFPLRHDTSRARNVAQAFLHEVSLVAYEKSASYLRSILRLFRTLLSRRERDPRLSGQRRTHQRTPCHLRRFPLPSRTSPRLHRGRG